MSGDFFGENKSVKNGDPISIAVFVIMVFIMVQWLITPSISPAGFPLSGTSGIALSTFVSSFTPVLIMVIPLTIAMFIEQLLESVNVKEARPRFSNKAIVERAFVGATYGIHESIKAKRLAKRESKYKHETPKHEREEESE